MCPQNSKINYLIPSFLSIKQPCKNTVLVVHFYLHLSEMNMLKCMFGVCSSWWQSLTEPPCRHANGGGCSVGAVEHRRWHLWLLPHQRNRGQDPHTGKCPLYPSVCDCLPVCWPDTPHDLYTMEKTLIGTELRNLVLSQAPWGWNSPFTRQQDYLDKRCPHLNKAGPQLLKFLWNLISDALPFHVCYCVCEMIQPQCDVE